LNFARPAQLATPLRALQFRAQSVELLLQFRSRRSAPFLFATPLSSRRIFFQTRQLFSNFVRRSLPRDPFLFSRPGFHLELHDSRSITSISVAIEIELDLETRGRLVDQIDRFVGQKSIADVAMRQHRRRDQAASRMRTP